MNSTNGIQQLLRTVASRMISPTEDARLKTDDDLYEVLCRIDAGEQFSVEIIEKIKNWKTITWSRSFLEVKNNKLPKCLNILAKLTNLDLHRTKVEDISALSGLTSLTNLDLCFTEVKDISALSGLTALTNLDLRYTKVEDISAMSGLTSLTNLNLCETKVEDISALSGLTALTNLDLRHTNVRDINALSRLTSFTNLDLSNTGVSDISALSGLTALTNLALSYTKVEDISAMSGLTSLTNLNLRHTNVRDINALSRLTSLTNLDLSYTKVSDISALSGLTTLTNLDLAGSQVSDVSILSNLTALTNLDLFNTKVRDVRALSGLTSLTNLNLRGTKVEDISALSGLTALANLDLSNTGVSDISALNGLTALTNLDLLATKVSDISALSSLTALTNLDLLTTKVSDISALSGLTALTNLDLRNLTLTELPEFLLDLNVPFVDIDGFFFDKGINIHNVNLKNQDITIFLSNDRSLIREYYRQQREASGESPLNEVKVVFLGDGGAGKTLAIERLMLDGEKPKNFDGESTPGISINSKTYKIGGDDIEVHFWDFGGQEILHSMHRLFLTQRTLYVVFLNARDNKQDGQAWYWLNNIRSFAKDAPALIIINQMDQNRNAALNETGLRDFYPALSENILKISALNDSPEDFNAQVTESIKREIDRMASVRVSFPNQWKHLMDEIQGMAENFIQAETFRKKCAGQGIELGKDIFDSIISLFQDTGVCFCSRKNAFQSDYMVLKPEWLTNAIYILVFNGRRYAKNGILTEDDCLNLFREDVKGKEAVKRVRKDISYEPAHVRYILDVIQNFGLLYRIDKERFFMPMLCDPDERDFVKDFLKSGDTLHTSFEYDYLPVNVIHRLVVRFGEDIRMEQVWRTGAVFDKAACGWQALIYIRQNKLEIHVKGKNEDLYPGAAYSKMLSETVAAINRDMGLPAVEFVYYKWQGKEQAFEREELEGSLENGIDEVYSKLRKGKVRVKDILAAYTVSPEAKKQELLRQKLSSALGKLQGNKDYLKENNYNGRVRDMMEMAGYVCKDETRSGWGLNRNESGELDILFRDGKTGEDLAIYEALRMDSFGKSDKEYLDRHLTKLLNHYNLLGLPYLYLVSYVSWSKEAFAEKADCYCEHVRSGSGSPYSVTGSRELRVGPGQYIRCLEVNYACGATPMTVYHFVVRMGE